MSSSPENPSVRLVHGRWFARSLALVAGVGLTAAAADWREWRGPDRTDHSPDRGLLKQWPAAGPRLAWLNRDVGLGFAGFAVVDGKLFTLGLRDDRELLLALDAATGREIWSAPIGPKYSNDWGDGPRGTPTVDGDRVFALGGQGTLVCVRIGDGGMVWRKSLVSDLGGKLQDWGYTESPLVVGDLVLCTPGGAEGTMAALRKDTGAVAWRSVTLSDHAQYASPILARNGDRPQVIQLVQKKYFGIDPADGRLLWYRSFPGRVAVIPTPIYHDGQVYVTAGYGAGCSSVRLDSSNKATLAYENKVMKNHHGGVILVDGRLYGHSDGDGWICQDFRSGSEVWVHKGFPKGAVAYADGMLYCLAEDSGEVALVEASPKGWIEHGRFKIDPQTQRRKPRGRIWTHPVIVNGRLYLRDQELLFCYDVKG